MEKGKKTEKSPYEKHYENNIKRQLQVLEALGKDYINISLINTRRQTALLLKIGINSAEGVEEENEEVPYEDMCWRSIEKYAPEEQREAVREKVKLAHIMKELMSETEYSFTQEVILENEHYDCQMKYISLGDPDYILMAFRLTDDSVSRENRARIRKSAEELKKERMFLEMLARDYTSVYYFDLEEETIEILKLDENANAARRFGTQLRRKLNYPLEMKKYCENYVIKEDQEKFLKVLSCDFIREKLKNTDRFVYRYQSNPNRAGQHYFEAVVMKVSDAGFQKSAILAFRHIDEQIKAEKERERELKAAVEMEERNKWLEKERGDAVSANKMKSQFLSSISHDIRTPINGIQGMLRIADNYPNDLKKQNECREKMWIATNYLVSLVNNVLNMNHLENKCIDLSEQPFNLIDLLMSVTAMADMQTKAQGLYSVVDWKPGYITHRYLIGSAEGLSRIMMNLNSNAVKYNKKGESIYCRCMELECDGETAWFEFVTRDTGIGMNQEFLKRAFDAYVQENNPSLNSINGVGLGLSIVKQTVEVMGGTLEVKSEVGKGTEYTIRLPFKIDHNPHIEKPNFENVSLKGVKALLVEDNDLNMEIAKFHLEQEDIEVFTAVNGQQALEMFEESEVGYYDIILMDIMMPIMNGLDATRRIRSLNRADSLVIPIIAMSANAFEKDIEEALESGLNDYLVKPVDGKKITDTMKKYLANKIRK